MSSIASRASNRVRPHSLVAGFIVALCSAGLALAQTATLPNRKDPLEGITSAGQPTAEQLTAAATEGFKTVIDLRPASEDHGMDERVIVEKLGMRYVTLPVSGAKDISYANAAALDKLLAEAKGPVLLHCASGNRAGALLALRAKLKGADDESALALGVASGVTGLQPTVIERIKAGHD
ncbi:MAG: protein tyrosine phosphatase family protein [Steroidobacteraceae bacterium]